MNFYHFPYDFNHKSNFFRSLLIRADELYGIDCNKVDIYGAYPLENILSKTKLYIESKLSEEKMKVWLQRQNGISEVLNNKNFNIWVTYENRRPFIESYDLTLSFDIDAFDERNYYLPLVYLYLRIDGLPEYSAIHDVSMDYCSEWRVVSKDVIANRNRFASSFINNPHPLRFTAINELSKISEVDVFGRSVGKYVENKIDRAKDYWFNICFENDLYPGYVTEKILESWLAQSIPLYWGDDKNGILNPEAYINLAKFEDLKEFTSHVATIYKDKNRMIEIIEQPLFRKKLEVDQLLQFIAAGWRRKFHGLVSDS
jgi:alpha(1,3/1,4) fucosyltransferase